MDIELTPIPRYEPAAVPAEQAIPDPDADRIWADWVASQSGRNSDGSSPASVDRDTE